MALIKRLKCEHCGEHFTPERNYHPYRFCSVICRNRANALKKVRPFEVRVWEKVDRKGPDECWQWLGGRNRYGKLQGRQAHKIIYELLVGPVPEGKELDHLCRNRYCVNPAHLEPVTHRENVLRGDGTAAKNARMTLCKKGHGLTLEKNGKRRCRICSRDGQRARRALLDQA